MDPPRVPVLLSDEHSADEAEAASFPESSLTKRTVMPGSSAAGKSSRHRVRKEGGVLFCYYKFFF